jgi:hypothetical protein
MASLQKKLDNKTRSALAYGQVALNPRVIGRNRSEIAVFLCPTVRKAVGCGGNTTPACRENPRRFQSRFKTPGTLESATLENDWRFTMSSDSIVSISDALQLLSLIKDIPKSVSSKHQDVIKILLAQAETDVYRARVPDHPVFAKNSRPTTSFQSELDRLCDVIEHVSQSIFHIPEQLQNLDCVDINYASHIRPIVAAGYVLRSVVDDLEQNSVFRNRGAV